MKFVPSFIIISIVYLCNISFAAEGSFSVCNIQTFSILPDTQASEVFVTCSGDSESLFLHIINPTTLTAEKTFQFNGLILDAVIIGSGQKILVALSELDGNSDTQEGMLVEIDYNTGNMLRSHPLSRSPEIMAVDNTETFAYLSIGLYDPSVPSDIVKVDISNFQIVAEQPFGNMTRTLSLTPDGSKLYADSNNIRFDLGERGGDGVGVFNTSNLSITQRIPLNSRASYTNISPDGSELYIATGSSFGRYENGLAASLYIVDTSIDQVSDILHFTYDKRSVSTSRMVIDPITNKLFTPISLQDNAPGEEGGIHKRSNLILEFDLTNHTHSFIEIDGYPSTMIALAQTLTGPRLFVTDRRNDYTELIYYKDL